MKVALDLTIQMFNRTAVYDIGMEMAQALKKFDPIFRYGNISLKRVIPFRDNQITSFLGKAVWRTPPARWLFTTQRLSKLLRNSNGVISIHIDPLFTRGKKLDQNDIIVVHDMGHITHKEYCDDEAHRLYSEAYHAIEEQGPSLVFVSHASKSEFERLYPGHAGPRSVILNYNIMRSEASSLARPAAEKEKFFLAVGTMDERKNYERLIKAFELSQLSERGYQLKICGPRGNVADNILKLIQETAGVEHTGFIPRETLSELYASATACVFPSLMEGFGLPAIEAPGFGTLPVLSTIPSLKEVGGDDALYFDPFQITEISASLNRAADMDAEEYNQRVRDTQMYQSRFELEHFHSAWEKLIDERLSA